MGGQCLGLAPVRVGAEKYRRLNQQPPESCDQVHGRTGLSGSKRESPPQGEWAVTPREAVCRVTWKPPSYPRTQDSQCSRRSQVQSLSLQGRKPGEVGWLEPALHAAVLLWPCHTTGLSEVATTTTWGPRGRYLTPRPMSPLSAGPGRRETSCSTGELAVLQNPEP